MEYIQNLNKQVKTKVQLQSWLKKNKKIKYSVCKNNLESIRLLTRVNVNQFAGIILFSDLEDKEIWTKLNDKDIVITPSGFMYYDKYNTIVEYNFIQHITDTDIKKINSVYQQRVKYMNTRSEKILQYHIDSYLNGYHITPAIFIALCSEYDIKIEGRTKYWIDNRIISLNINEENKCDYIMKGNFKSRNIDELVIKLKEKLIAEKGEKHE